MTRTWLQKSAALLLTVGLLAGCGGAKPDPAPAPAAPGTPAPAAPAPAAKKFKAGMITDIGGINDESFNAASWAGLEKAGKDLGYETRYVESKRQEEYEPNFQVLIDQEYDLLWGIGFLMGPSTEKMAKQLTNQKFGLIDAAPEAAIPNVASVLFKEEEGSFLMGVMAAKTSKNKTVGFVGGMNIPVIHHFEAGFKAGVKATDPEVKVITVYAEAFDNPAKGKEIALSMINQKADVIFHAAGSTGNGAIEAAKEQNVFAIGVDKDQNALAPQHVISSMMKRVDVAIYDITKATAEGKFPGGKTSVLGLKEDAVGYAPSTLWDKMPAGTKELVDKYAQAIKDGKFTVPNSMEAFTSWTAPQL